METMADADNMSIAWPYKKLKVVNRPSMSAHGFAVFQGLMGNARGRHASWRTHYTTN